MRFATLGIMERRHLGDAGRVYVWCNRLLLRPMDRRHRLVTGAAVACGLLALALTVATAQRAKPCDVVEPEFAWDQLDGAVR